MKKLFVLLAFLFGAFANIVANPVDVFFIVGVIGKGGTANPLPKSPLQPPIASLEDSVLTIESLHPDFTLIIMDEEGFLVYQTLLSASITTLTLPSTLSGNYVLWLIPANSSYYFYSTVNL